MKAKFFLFLFVAILSFSEVLKAQTQGLNFSRIDTRLGLGAAFNPGLVYFMGDVEVRLDSFFSLGPMLQLGTSKSRDMVAPSFGGRFILPSSFFRSLFQKGPKWEFSLQTGMGFLYRNINGLEFNNFLYEISGNVDVFLIQNLSLGVGGAFNLTGSSVERWFSSLFGSLAYRF